MQTHGPLVQRGLAFALANDWGIVRLLTSLGRDEKTTAHSGRGMVETKEIRLSPSGWSHGGNRSRWRPGR